jgi:hypothetical protein
MTLAKAHRPRQRRSGRAQQARALEPGRKPMGSKAKIDPVIADEVPWSDHVTEYDEEHFITYLRLLDADAEGACKEEMARIVLGIDAAKEPERAQKALESHLARAHWMTEPGYRDLLKDTNARD